ncbi:mannosyl-3-phosphoglycerate phosphatase [Maritimibacter sp. DP1N21-5]|uniref:HAD-IIB family hydrolase n=1 Tax=Maritimibacter sp. DP1N21-5 TaxID=2836867 RepID=UPI001C467206|nr:HAD-IIB family hydrolase [Maritimibacter sp. DP1N21-5]MBV7410634.1 HAD-IIB family hydrolase [Maritimibacter sp. DP1N21-5]
MTDAPHLPILIFSDLDGTLLDHHSYDWGPARPALDRLRRMGDGVVLATSKTAAEVVNLRRDMGLTDWPAIVENGAGTLPAHVDHLPEAPDYAALRAALDALPDGLRTPFTGFGDMDIPALARTTGLPLVAAADARARGFSEPGLWTGDHATRNAFVAALAEMGIHARMGGRFLTLSFGRTKADAMAEVTRALAPGVTVALGDAPNDVEMLEAADIGIVIPNPDAAPLPPLKGEKSGKIRRATAPGPVGWNLSVSQVIDEVEKSQKGAAHG